MTEELRIAVPTISLSPTQQRSMQKIYLALMDEFAENMNEFVDRMEAVKAGKAFVDGEKLDMKKFSDYVVTWRKKQGETQKKIAEIELKDPVLFLSTRTAYLNLRRMGSMVSKRARNLQNDVTKQYGEKNIDPRPSQWYERNYLFRVGTQDLERQYGRILELIGLPRPTKK